MSAPPPPPPPPAIAKKAPVPLPGPQPPAVASTGPPGDFLVELLIFNGAPFKDHWAYWVRSHNKPEKGVLIHARGDVRNGFELQTSRAHDFELTGTVPMKRIPLQWVNGKHFDEKLMMNSGVHKFDVIPVCSFEASAFKVPAPGKTLNAVNEDATPGKKITQRNCQTWIVESADQLVRDNIFSKNVADYLHAIKQ